jgi:tetratricopeptide (TPR) repeat protein
MNIFSSLFGKKQNLKALAEDHFSKGAALAQAQQWPAAIEALSEAVRLNPNHARAHMCLVMFRPKWKHSNPSVRLDAVKRLTDQALLAQVVRTAPACEIRVGAVEKLTDQAALKSIRQQALARAPKINPGMSAAEVVAVMAGIDKGGLDRPKRRFWA